jgi:hypothetical protein
MSDIDSKLHHTGTTTVPTVEPAFVDKAGLAALLNKSPRYVEHLVERRLVPYFRIPGKRPGIIKTSVGGRVVERATRGGQLFFSPRKVIAALGRYEVQAEISPAYRTRRQLAVEVPS